MATQFSRFDFSPAAPRRGSKLILSVDDEPHILHTREKILEAKGYSVLSALDGEDALELFDAHPVIDLVLLDYAMPGMDGAVVAEAMKSRRHFVPIFMITACEDLVASMKLNCVDAFISKGTGPAYLLEKIHHLFTLSTSNRSNDLQARSMELSVLSARLSQESADAVRRGREARERVKKLVERAQGPGYRLRRLG